MAEVYINQNVDTQFLLGYQKPPRLRRKERGVCGSKTRRGTACQAPPVWNKSTDKARNGRCKLHGGLSTGPKTEPGREAIRVSNRNRKILVN